MSQQLLQYSLQLSQVQSDNVAVNLTYVNTGQTATLTIVVSNKGAGVTVQSIDFGLGPFGQNATDLAASASAVTPILPAGWSVVAGTGFTVEPTTGSAIIGTAALTFAFQVNVNAAAGTSLLAITEISTAGTAHVSPIAITKMPSTFVLANVLASPALVAPGGTVDLSWSATPGQLYTIGFPGGTATLTPPSGGVASWISPAVQTPYPNVTYTVSASTQVSGQILSAEVSTTVQVDVPQIVSFTQPTPFYSTPITLQWETVNADYCVVYANGIVVDPNAPANPGSGGYQASPSAHVTEYQIHAFRNQRSVSSQSVYVTLYRWAFDRSFTPAKFGNICSTAITADGSVLYCGDNYNIFAIDTNGFTIAGHAVLNVPNQGPMPEGVAPHGLVLSPDGRTLYASMSRGAGGQISVYDTTNLAAAPGTIPLSGGPMALSPDGSTLYVCPGQSDEGYVSAVSTSTRSILRQGTGGRWVSMCVSRDGSMLYAIMEDGGLWALDSASLGGQYIAQVASAPCVRTQDGATLYCGAPTGTTLSNTVQSRSLPWPYSVTRSVQLPVVFSTVPDVMITSMAVDPSGGLFVSVVMPGGAIGGQTVQTALFFVDPNTAACTQLDAIPQQTDVPGLIVDPTGQRAYYANGNTIVVFSSMGGGEHSMESHRAS